MLVQLVKNQHALVHGASRLIVAEGTEDGVNRRLRHPVTYIVDRPLESASLWGADPFVAFAHRLGWATAQVMQPELQQAAKNMREQPIQVALGMGDAGRVHFQCNDALEAMVVEPFIDVADYDFGGPMFLMELLAEIGGMPVGRLWVTSPAYCARYENMPQVDKVSRCVLQDPYGHFTRRPVGSEDIPRLIGELPMLIEDGPVMGITHPYLRRVACPIFASYQHLVERRFAQARRSLERCESEDWNQACGSWINKVERTR